MTLLICGSTGYIGQPLRARALATGHAVVATSASGRDGTDVLDLAQAQAADLSRFAAGDLALVTAAISAPDVCAREPERAMAVNVHGTGALIEGLLARGVRVAFFSSDTVYGERRDPFDESAPAHPAGDYARMKHEVERRFAGHAGFKALRLSYVFSREDRFTQQLQGCANEARLAEIFDPFDRAVVHRDDVVLAALALAEPATWEAALGPVVNVGGPQVLSRVAYAETLRSRVWPALQVQVVTPPEGFFANRPRSIAMRSPLLPALLGRAPTTLAEAATLEFQGLTEVHIG